MSRFEKWSVLSTSVLTTLTGLVYIWLKYGLEPADAYAVVNHPWQPAVLKAHILVAPLLVFAVGTIATRHVWRHFRSFLRTGRRTGVSTMIALAPMVVTGYLLQAASDAAWIRGLAIAHIAFGVAYAVGLGGHWWVMRGGRADRPQGAERVEGSSARVPELVEQPDKLYPLDAPPVRPTPTSSTTSPAPARVPAAAAPIHSRSSSHTRR